MHSPRDFSQRCSRCGQGALLPSYDAQHATPHKSVHPIALHLCHGVVSLTGSRVATHNI